jgi:FkbM family methyltransferase
MIHFERIPRILRTEGLGGIAARIRRRWRLWRFRPHVLEKRHGDYRFRFHIGTEEGQEWYGRFVDTRLYKPVEAELAWLARAAAPGDVVADVGAHHAYFALLMGHWVGPTGKVYAFECLPENAEIGARNVALNDARNVEIVRKAIGSKAGTVEIVNNSGGALGPRAPGVDVLRVEMIALDEFFTGRPPDLLKIDVEGLEFAVLQGARRCLLARPKIAVEIHCFPFTDPVAHVASVLALLPKDDYKYQIAFECGQALVDYTLTADSPAQIGKQYNPHLYGLPLER